MIHFNLDMLSNLSLFFFTSFWSPGYVISVLVLDKVFWPGLLGPVIQFAYVFEHDVVIALTPVVRDACLSAVT